MKKTSILATESNYSIVVDKVPYLLRVTPYLYNDEKRFRVSINGDSGHVFAWDPEIVGLHAIDDDAVVLPGRLEKAISDKLAKTIAD